MCDCIGVFKNISVFAIKYAKLLRNVQTHAYACTFIYKSELSWQNGKRKFTIKEQV